MTHRAPSPTVDVLGRERALVAVFHTAGETPSVVVPFLPKELERFGAWVPTLLSLLDAEQREEEFEAVRWVIQRLVAYGSDQLAPQSIGPIPDTVMGAALALMNPNPETGRQPSPGDVRVVVEYIAGLADMPGRKGEGDAGQGGPASLCGSLHHYQARQLAAWRELGATRPSCLCSTTCPCRAW